ncbi:hypothetical protein [Flavicella sediminum]|uniref:hypothetical protein n=1 Tax=Flavicella sediminum TaxID=2585141 RepID=UPI00111DFF40|nr:hypothetical protein [Flavicella sediminum]
MREELNFSELLKLASFSKIEEKILCNLNNRIDKSLKYKIDENIESAKFNYVKNEITIKTINDYSSLIHELLHAELIIFHKFPTIKDINEILTKYKQPRLKKLIATLTNDIHHFIFNDKFQKATKHRENSYLVSNQKSLLESNLSYIHLEKGYNQQGIYLNKVLFYYESIFIINRYKILLMKNIIFCEKLIKLDNNLYEIFNNFFNSILVLSKKPNVEIYKSTIINIYTNLIVKIKNNQNNFQ